MGLVYGAGVMCIGPVTGASLNPFRYLGPALLILNPLQSHIYVIGPSIGAYLGFVVYTQILKDEDVTFVTLDQYNIKKQEIMDEQKELYSDDSE